MEKLHQATIDPSQMEEAKELADLANRFHWALDAIQEIITDDEHKYTIQTINQPDGPTSLRLHAYDN